MMGGPAAGRRAFRKLRRTGDWGLVVSGPKDPCFRSCAAAIRGHVLPAVCGHLRRRRRSSAPESLPFSREYVGCGRAGWPGRMSCRPKSLLHESGCPRGYSTRNTGGGPTGGVPGDALVLREAQDRQRQLTPNGGARWRRDGSIPPAAGACAAAMIRWIRRTGPVRPT